VSKKEKLYQRLHKLPPPKDFAWEDLISLMRQAGFSEECDGGSHYTFEHKKTGFRLGISKTHPSGVLKRYQINDAKTALETVNYYPGKENEQG
jgi:predicted RNA binding protein YcfA (HicA-like mRNA interferase family)